MLSVCYDALALPLKDIYLILHPSSVFFIPFQLAGTLKSSKQGYPSIACYILLAMYTTIHTVSVNFDHWASLKILKRRWSDGSNVTWHGIMA